MMCYAFVLLCVLLAFLHAQPTVCNFSECGTTVKVSPVLLCNGNISDTESMKSSLRDHETRISRLENRDGVFLEKQHVNCSDVFKGRFRFASDGDVLQICDGTQWQSVLTTASIQKRGGSRDNPASTCQEIYATGQTSSGIYWINPDPSVYRPVRVFCEMQFNGGGWLRIYNMMAMPAGSQYAQKMYEAITRNGDLKVVLANETTHVIHSKGLRLELYREVVYGWARSADNIVSHYGYYKKPQGIKGDCYVDSFCGNGKAIAAMTSSPTGTVRNYATPANPTYPHVGVSWATYQVVWGYDKNTAPYGNWGNWQDTSCCLSAASKEIHDAGLNWRYSILIR